MSSAKSYSSTARLIRSRPRTFSRSRGASMSGRWAPMGSFRGRRSETRNHGNAPTSCRSFIRHGDELRKAGQAGLPIPSIRLKAYRRGQQDVEYLTLWSSLNQEPRWAVGSRARGALKLTGTRQATGTTDAEDAGRVDYARLHSRELWAFRTAIGKALSQARPAFQSKLVDFRTPRRDPDHLPGAYVGE